MKTLTKITIVLVCSTLFSCNKVYDCNCSITIENNNPNIEPTFTYSTFQTQEMSKKDAESYCDYFDSDAYDGVNWTEKDCNIKLK